MSKLDIHEVTVRVIRKIIYHAWKVKRFWKNHARKIRLYARSLYLISLSEGETRYFTCTGKVDGIGAQMKEVFHGMVYAEAHGLRFVYTPLKYVEHTNNSSLLLQMYENFFNFRNIAPLTSEVDWQVINIPVGLYKSFERLRFRKPVLLTISHCRGFSSTQEYKDSYRIIREKAQIAYGKRSVKFPSIYEAGTLHVAVHIRRGDATPTSLFSYSYTCDSYYVRMIELIRAVFNDGEHVAFHVFSQGEESDFPGLSRLFPASVDLRWHLDKDILWSIQHLVDADILIQAKSSFSHLAGMFSQGIVIAEKYQEVIMDDWLPVSVSESGEFDPVPVRDLLVAGLREKCDKRVFPASTRDNSAALLR